MGLDGGLCVGARAASDAPGTVDSTEKFSLMLFEAARALTDVVVAAASFVCSSPIAASRLRFLWRLCFCVFVKPSSSCTGGANDLTDGTSEL